MPNLELQLEPQSFRMLARSLKILFFVVPVMAIADEKVERPNIVWLVSEDNSVHYLRLYEEGGAPMPNLERLADQGIVFNNAFSNTPVCSTARSAIISGCYGPRTFSNFHRREALVPLPDGLKMFPWYLRQSGYYTTNNSKEDYNYIKTDGVWDESSGKATYRNRKDGQPFFHVQNFGTTHESRLHFSEAHMQNEKTVTDPNKVPVFPRHPDTPLFRYTNAYYRDLHMKLDAEMGDFLDKLESEGLMEYTIIFYYGDHGGVLPGSKGYLNESGLHVPMVVYAPEKWKHLMPAKAGSRVDGFVQFTDLAPTVLSLAGLKIPEQIDGKAFLGKSVSLKELENRDSTFSYADRFDEKFDMVRALRKGNFKYIRNYQPFNVDGVQNNYRYKMLAYQEWRDLFKAGKLNKEQSQFFEARPVEELYDLQNDPQELHNLATDPAHKKELKSLREALKKQVKSMPDLGFLPESVLLTEAVTGPVAFGQKNKQRIGRLVDVADLSLKSFKQAKKGIVKALHSEDPWQRYWALIVCSSFGKEAKPLVEDAKKLAESDSVNLVRVRAVEFLALIDVEDPQAGMAHCLQSAESLAEAALILNSVAFLHDTKGYSFRLDRDWVSPDWLENTKSNVFRRFEYLEAN